MDEINCNIDDFSNVLANALSQFSDEETHKVKDIITESAKNCAKNLKQTSPKRTGKYAKGWKARKDSETNLDIEYTVYNSTRPSITHLLENGHAKRDGGRVEAIPHIAPAEEKMEKEIETKIDELGGD